MTPLNPVPSFIINVKREFKIMNFELFKVGPETFSYDGVQPKNSMNQDKLNHGSCQSINNP
jgi:hypothetical protein